MTIIWVALGSALGGAARYWCSGALARTIGQTFPWGTLTVNVLSSVLVGLFMALTGPDGRVLVGSDVRQFVALGLFGGFTTFSSVSLHTPNLAQNGEWLRAGAYVLSSVALCLFGVWLGHALGVAINR